MTGQDSINVTDLLAAWPDRDDPPAGTGGELGEQLEAILKAAASAFGFIQEKTGQGGLIDRNKYDPVVSMLETIAGFETFSLAEYTYGLEDSTPGIRLWLEGPPKERRVCLILFPDVRQWRVDWRDRKISLKVLSLILTPQGIKAEPNEELKEHFPAHETWLRALFRGLFLPLSLETLPE